MKHLKKLTILHSNDMHGDFLAKKVDDKLLGGVSLLSGYINKVRSEEENVLYAIAGDMFRGSVIDSEYKGLSTIEIMNMLAPDVVTLGNHEVDYGIGHLLFIEKCARFPIINANMYLTTNHVRLFNSHVILEVDGMKILFIGVLTEEVLAQARQEKLVGAIVDVYEAATEIGKICNAYQTEDIDFTVLLTHIGFEEDKRLAELLDPRWNVDVIIGGHSHTLLEEPCVVNGIPIVQAATGTGQIGRFDIMVDTDKNAIDSYTWELIPIDETHCPRDTALEEVILKYKDATDEKYGRYVTRFTRAYTNPGRNQETEIGRLFSDIICDNLGLDIMFMASGSFRAKSLGPIVQYQDLIQMFPFHDEIFRVTVNGAQLKRMVQHIFREEFFEGERIETYQISHGLRVVCSVSEKRVKEITFEGKEIDDEALFKIGLQGFHFKNMDQFFGVTEEEATENGPYKVLSTSAMDVLDEYLSRKEIVKCPMDERWVMEE
ncbi:MAG: bifunctional metallophosphatase/5'-nucleotidase [Lachnospiraceae bacterium]|nr:bifunctional metallophosphatase/5'-nucleotidase [Lachnospiraceae bacterium]